MQMWHLHRAVQALGHEVSVINYLHETHHRSNQKKVPIRGAASLKQRVHWWLKRRQFKGLEGDLCEGAFTTRASEVDWKSYDRVVVGSDVVWDFETEAYGHDPAYFGGLEGQDPGRMVSYAASCGPARVDGDLPDYCCHLRTFKALSIRDGYSAKLVARAAERDAELVVDPTWLGDDPVCRNSLRMKKPYLMVYGTTLKGEFAEAVAEMCRRKGWDIVSAAARCPVADRTFRSLSPFQWVDLLKNAEATVVSGLHGTLYSIKYRKPFVLILNHNTRQKASKVLELTGQEHRQFEREELTAEQVGLLDRSLGEPPGVPPQWRQSSIEFLRSSLA